MLLHCRVMDGRLSNRLEEGLLPKRGQDASSDCC